MDEHEVRIGLIGCGGIAQHGHLPAIRRTPSERLVAVADAFGDLALLVARGNGLETQDAYDDHRRLLERDDVDAVVICAWTGLHADLAVEALHAGKHVLLEKPMAVTGADARRMVAAAESADRILMVAYNHTYDPAATHLKSMLEAGDLGDLLYVEVFFYEDAGAWDAGAYRSTVRSKEHRSGWPKHPEPRLKLLHYIHNFDSHLLNLMRVLLGEPEGIDYCRWIPNAGLWAMFDYGGFKTYFKNVETGQRRFEKGMELCGARKRVRLSLAPPLQRYSAGTLEVVDAESQCITRPLLPYRWPFELEQQHFAECVLQGKEPLTSGRRALNDVLIAEQLVQVALPETDR